MRLYFSYDSLNLSLSIEKHTGVYICIPCNVTMVNVEHIYSVPNLHYFELNTSMYTNFTVYLGGSSFPEFVSTTEPSPVPPSPVPPSPPVVPPSPVPPTDFIYVWTFPVFLALVFVYFWTSKRKRKKRTEYSIKTPVFNPTNELVRETLKF